MEQVRKEKLDHQVKELSDKLSASEQRERERDAASQLLEQERTDRDVAFSAAEAGIQDQEAKGEIIKRIRSRTDQI